MRLVTARFARLALVAQLLAPASASSRAADGFTMDSGVTIPMRDGTPLKADVYRPAGPGKHPVLLIRTPYNRRGAVPSALKMVQRGYVVVAQDTRGRFSSAGEFVPFVNEAQDGYDTVEWAAAQPWSDGRVGMFGASNVGATQLLAATAKPPHLVGIAPVITASNYFDGWTYQGGAFALGFDSSWTSLLAEDTLGRRMRTPVRYKDWTWLLPLAGYPVLDPGPADAAASYYKDWLAHPSYDAYWKAIDVSAHHGAIGVPALHVGGWYDIFQGGTWRNYVGLHKGAATPEARRGQRLVLGPWSHAGSTPVSGDFDFGPTARGDYDELTLAFYDELFLQKPAAMKKPVRLFVMGTNVWRDEEDWPLARAQVTRYHLHSAGHAPSLRGDGLLSVTPPKGEPADHFVHDPDDPVPTRGGGLCCDNTNLPPGAFDQRPVEGRGDVLVYSTPPLARPLEVTGPVTLELWVSASTVDADVTGKLVDVSPDGTARNLTDGVLRLRFRDSRERPAPLVPGAITRVTVDLWATSNVFLPGHRVRLEVAGSNFPRFDRNLGTGENAAHSARYLRSTVTIVHDAAHPSALLLPVVPAGK